MLPIFKGLFHLGTDIVTGIDVGAFSTKVVSVRRKNGAKEILYVKEFPVIPYEKFDASLERVAEELSLNAAAKNSRLVLSVPLGNYSYFFLNIPKIPDDELLSAVEWELKKHLTSPVEEYTFDYVIVREFSDENMRKYEVFTVAAPRSDTLKLLNIFKSRKLSVSSITVNPLALVGLTDFLPPSEKNETLVIGSIGFLKTEMVIVINGALRFARVIKLGISQIVSNLSQNYGIPREKSLILLKEKGFGAESGQKEVIISMLSEAVGKFALEFQRFIDYFYAQYPNEVCDKMYLVGGGAVMPGLIEAFQPFFDFKVDVFTPPSAVSIINKNFKEELTTIFSTAAGLALSGGQD